LAEKVEKSLQRCGPVAKKPGTFRAEVNHHGESLMSKIIEVTVSPSGETKVQTKGYAGSECLQASKFLEDALGVATKETRTVEFYEEVKTEEHVQQQ
jgi:Protein of unknown function (DUF2997)